MLLCLLSRKISYAITVHAAKLIQYYRSHVVTAPTIIYIIKIQNSHLTVSIKYARALLSSKPYRSMV